MQIAPADRKLLASLAALVVLSTGLQAQAQFTPPTCVPPNCSPAVIQNLLVSGTAQTASINITGDAKLGATLQVGASAPVMSAVGQNLIYGNVGATSSAGGLMLLQKGAADVLRFTVAGQEQLPLGSAALPSYSFLGDTNTGIYESGPDSINFVTGGVSRLAVDALGAVTVPGTLVVTGSFSAASFTGVGSALTGLNAANISSGTLNDLRLSVNVPLVGNPNVFTGINTFSNAANSFTGTHVGSGAGLTSLNATNMTSGSLPDARLSANVAFLANTQTFSGINTFSNAGNSFTGTHAGNGAGLTSLNASNLSSGTVADARLSGTYSGALTLSGNDTFSGMSSFGGAGLVVGAAQNLIYGNIAPTSTGSLVLLQKNSIDQFRVDNAGNVTAAGNITVAGQSVCRANGTNCPPTVNGSGTLNQVIKFTPNGNAVGNSQIYDNGTNVGIGTTTPGAALDVKGSGLLMVGDAFYAGSNVVAANNFQRYSMGYGIYWNSASGNYTVTDPTYNQSSFSDENSTFTWTQHSGALSSPQTYAQWHANDRMQLDSLGNLFVGGIIRSAGTPVCLSNGTGCPPTIGGSGTVNYVPKFSPNGTTLANSLIQDNGTNLGVGGIYTNFDKMTVYGSLYTNGEVTGYTSTPNAGYFQTTAANGIGVTGTGQGYGVYGFSTTAGGYGVYGSYTGGGNGAGVAGSSNGLYGVLGTAPFVGGMGVYGSGDFAGVYGTGNHGGIVGTATGFNSTDYGVSGTIPGGSTAAGVAGFTTNTGNGVYGTTNGSGSGIRGVTNGTGSGGTFQTTTANGTGLTAIGTGAGKAIVAQGDVQMLNGLTVGGPITLGSGVASSTTVNGSMSFVGGNGTGFALPVGTVAPAIPATLNGRMYYDTGVNKFRCQEGGAWKDCIPGAFSGTTNFVPKFASATTLGNSLIYDTGSAVGIGTTTPGALLDVNSAAGLTAVSGTTSGSYGVYGKGAVNGVFGDGPVAVYGSAQNYAGGFGVQGYGGGTTGAGVVGTGGGFGGKFLGTAAGGQGLHAYAIAPATMAIAADGDLQVLSGKTMLNHLGNQPQTANYANADLVLGDDTTTRNGYGGTNGSSIMLQSIDKSTITALDEGQNLGQISYQNLNWTIGESVPGYGVSTVTMPGPVGANGAPPSWGYGISANGTSFGGDFNGGTYGVYAYGTSFAFYGAGNEYLSGYMQTNGDLSAPNNTWGPDQGWYACGVYNTYCSCPNGSFIGEIYHGAQNQSISGNFQTHCFKP